jgi:DNA-binding transcriptional LysR family regulator
MAVDVRLLKPFMATAEKLSFTKAAEEIGISQPRLSLLIKKLEDQLGFPLFLRWPHHVRLSDEGTIFLEQARNLLDAIRLMDGTVSQLRGELRSRLRLGSPVTTVGSFPDRGMLIEEFAARHPKIRLKVESDFAPSLVARLRQGRLDLTIASLPVDTNGLNALPLAHSVPHLAIPKGHPLAKESAVTTDMLDGITVAVLPRNAATEYIRRVHVPLKEAGAKLMEAYEPTQATIMPFASKHSVCAIVQRWRGQTEDYTLSYPGFAIRPLSGIDAGITMVLLKKAGAQPAPVEWFWQLAQGFVKRSAEISNQSNKASPSRR